MSQEGCSWSPAQAPAALWSCSPKLPGKWGGSLLSHQREEGAPILEFLSGISWVSGCARFRVPFRGQLKLRAQEGFLEDL